MPLVYVPREKVITFKRPTIREVPQLKAKLVTFAARGQRLPIRRNRDSMNNSLSGIRSTEKFVILHVPNNYAAKVFASSE
jgi:hypothetical protein